MLCQTKQLSYVFYRAFSYSSLVFPVHMAQVLFPLLLYFSSLKNDRLEGREKMAVPFFAFPLIPISRNF